MPWQKASLIRVVRQEAVRRGPVRVSLLAAAGPHEAPAVVGCVLVTIRNAEMADGLLDTSPVHLKACLNTQLSVPQLYVGSHTRLCKVWLEDLRWSQSLHAVYIVAKLGRDQEIVAHLAKEGHHAT